MGRLTGLPPRLAGLPPRLASTPIDAADRDRKRNEFHPWRAWYKTPLWRALRMATFTRDLFTCTMCGRIEGDTSKLVADHDTPHRGDRGVFFDPNNLKTLCASPCHSKHKQRLEQAAEHR
ncbi:HNH endonuclease [Sphingomonas naphthae]|uniref:HNH endonuclease n=1 Tax=Sphingomonas naphthae TaxID=1813468 RepID=A0ABY7TPR8_9SPHN|nr:HNH endonuclease [Sphingomonas naphthae]WCT75023.1 HNH endonuclease [Sphingomonas naphthae]